MNLKKMLVIFMLFTAVAFVYVLVTLNKVTKNVSKIEAFSNTADAVTTTTTTVPVSTPSTTANLPTRLNPTDFGKAATAVLVTDNDSVKPIVATVAPIAPITPIVATTAATTTTPVITTSANGTPIISSVPTALPTVATPLQVPKVVQEVIAPVTSTSIAPVLQTAVPLRETQVSLHTQPSPSLPIADDEERRFWIGNVLYNLMPNNGMAKFMNDVNRLSDKLRYDTFGTIVQNLRDYVASKLSRDERVMRELATTIRDMKSNYYGQPAEGLYYDRQRRTPWDSGYSWPGYMALDSPMAGGYHNRHVPTTYRGNGFLFPADHVEMFTEQPEAQAQPKNDNGTVKQMTKVPEEAVSPPMPPLPRSYVREYGMHDTWSRSGSSSADSIASADDKKNGDGSSASSSSAASSASS